MSRRAPGRPVSAERFGREKIISGFRALVREGRGQILRKDIADHLGITPALVTYYFPDSSSILREALTGIFDQWIVKINEADSDDPTAVIDVIFCFFRVELHAEDLLRSAARSGLINDDVLMQMENRTAEKILKATSAAEDRAAMAAKIIWGSARQCALSGLEEYPTTFLKRMIHAILSTA